MIAILGRFSKYIGVAGGSAIVDWLVFTGLFLLTQSHLPAQLTARASGGLFSFLANRFWSFSAKGRSHVSVQGRRFLLLYAFSYTLSLSSLYVLVDLFGFNLFLSKLASDSLCLVVNFLVMHLYVFRDRDGLIALGKTLLRSVSTR